MEEGGCQTTCSRARIGNRLEKFWVRPNWQKRFHLPLNMACSTTIQKHTRKLNFQRRQHLLVVAICKWAKSQTEKKTETDKCSIHTCKRSATDYRHCNRPANRRGSSEIGVISTLQVEICCHLQYTSESSTPPNKRPLVTMSEPMLSQNATLVFGPLEFWPDMFYCWESFRQSGKEEFSFSASCGLFVLTLCHAAFGSKKTHTHQRVLFFSKDTIDQRCSDFCRTEFKQLLEAKCFHMPVSRPKPGQFCFRASNRLLTAQKLGYVWTSGRMSSWWPKTHSHKTKKKKSFFWQNLTMQQYQNLL